MTGAAVLIVSFGWGRVSLLEVFWLLVGLACVKDTACLFIEARATLAAAVLPPADEVNRLLAVVDLREAGQALLVQFCFLALGLVAALRPPPPPAASDDEALARLFSIGFLVAIQVSNVVMAHERRRYARRIDAELRAKPRAHPIPGGRRSYDPEKPS